jgi:hypothetical protein
MPVAPPSAGRYVLGALIMLAGVVLPLAHVWYRATRRGAAAFNRTLGCVPPGAARGCALRPRTRRVEERRRGRRGVARRSGRCVRRRNPNASVRRRAAGRERRAARAPLGITRARGARPRTRVS